MPGDEPNLICLHVNVPEMHANGSGVRFDFICIQATDAGEQLPGQKTVEVWFPHEVLASVVGSMPEVLDEMRKRLTAAANDPGGRPS